MRANNTLCRNAGMLTVAEKLRIVIALALSAAFALAIAPIAAASGPEQALKVHVDNADSVSSGEEVQLTISVQNESEHATNGPITVTDTLGAGFGPPREGGGTGGISSSATVPVGPTSCETAGQTLTCTVAGPLMPGAQLLLYVNTMIEPNVAGELTGSVSVSGGGMAEPVLARQHTNVGPAGAFGFTLAEASFSNADRSEDAQAGSVPAEFVTSLHWRTFSSVFRNDHTVPASVEHFKDVTAHLPPGLIGNPSATPALCTTDQLSEPGSPHVNVPNCPLDSQVGVAHIYLTGSGSKTPSPILSNWVGLFNMVAPHGVATMLGFNLLSTTVLLDAYVRPGDHGIDIVSRDTSTSAPIVGVEIVTWGVPSDPSHDAWRGGCLESSPLYTGPSGELCSTTTPRKAFLRTPTSCTGSPLAFGVESNSYEHPEHYASESFQGPTMHGCDILPFNPSISVEPNDTAASSPTGVSVKVSIPQSQVPDGLAEADLKKAVVTLPEGMALNPSSAGGLQACTDAQLHLDSNTPAECPDGSKVGTVLLHTQLIPNPIEGNIYVRTQNSFDPASGEMFRIVLELRDDSHGLDFKIPGRIVANPITGRLTSTFDDNPQFPFEDISLHFNGGARAPLVTPAACVSQTTEADFYSWAQPGTSVYRPSSYQLTSGPEGTPCKNPWPFDPGFEAGVKSVQAGAFTPFLVTFKRSDADQSMQRVSVKMPKGLLGSLVGLPLCDEAHANAGTCSFASEIGSVTAGAGAGPDPFYVTGGKVYMTGPYEGAPFGLSVVVPAKAGPFDLGTVVVRSKVEVDPHTAQLTVTTDPLPQVVGGVPVNLRLVNVTIDRPGFTYNPTDCNPTSVTGTMTGRQGATAALETHFQVTNCGALKFHPKFAVSTSGKTSRQNGASLTAKLTYPKTPQGTQANIAKVKVSLPKQLPSRLGTLQKACPAQTFEANPAACPTASRIGTATATTPVLPVPLDGPVYFVSHGGEAFPDLVVVLQGYGVTVDLVGSTFISKAGITSTTFKTVPDVPVGSFQLKLPQGPNSALAANGDLCASNLKMPTIFTGQDGAEIHVSTPINTTGCTKHKTHHKRKQHKHKKHRKK